MYILNSKYLKKIFIIFFFIITVILASIYLIKLQKNKDEVRIQEPIIINLITSVHPKLPWSFQTTESKVFIKPGEVRTIEYIVENLGNVDTTGIATFAYYPKDFGAYISKLNCFCYDAQTLKPKQKSNYSVVLLIDPKVTKDSKTKNIKEVTIQFIFFDYKDYKESKT